MTKQYAVIGNPIAHSLSPRIHSLFAEQTQKDISYEAIAVAPDEFEDTIDALVKRGFGGVNVTLPFKLSAAAIANTVSARVTAAAAANTLIFQKDQTILADNTDGVGLLLDLARLDLDLSQRTVMLIGAGGACRGILQPLLSMDVKAIYIANRSLERAQQLVTDFCADQRVHLCPAEAFKDCPFDVLINTSSSSVNHQLPAFLPAALPQSIRWGYDLFYSSQATVFVQWLQQQGLVHAHDGLGMLVGQAAESFFLWHRVRPEIASVIRQIKQTL